MVYMTYLYDRFLETAILSPLIHVYTYIRYKVSETLKGSILSRRICQCDR